MVLLGGHGSATDSLNCAEFCPGHHFSVGRGGPFKEFVKEHKLVRRVPQEGASRCRAQSVRYLAL